MLIQLFDRSKEITWAIPHVFWFLRRCHAGTHRQRKSFWPSPRSFIEEARVVLGTTVPSAPQLFHFDELLLQIVPDFRELVLLEGSIREQGPIGQVEVQSRVD